MKKDHVALLQQLFENVNAWLHFSEAKNGALIALNVALLAALFSSGLSTFCEILFSGTVVGLLCSTMLSLLSFRPIDKELAKTSSIGINENLLHYAYIASLNEDEYLTKIYERYWESDWQSFALIPQIEKDYSREIVQNSRVTMRKQLYFKLAFYIDIAIIITSCILVIYA